jgi:hypothetical protein
MSTTEAEFLDFIIPDGATAEELMDTFGLVPENDFGRIFEGRRSSVRYGVSSVLG